VAEKKHPPILFTDDDFKIIDIRHDDPMVVVPTRPRALTKVNTWWDLSRAQGNEKGDGRASGVDKPWALTSLGR